MIIVKAVSRTIRFEPISRKFRRLLKFEIKPEHCINWNRNLNVTYFCLEYKTFEERTKPLTVFPLEKQGCVSPMDIYSTHQLIVQSYQENCLNGCERGASGRSETTLFSRKHQNIKGKVDRRAHLIKGCCIAHVRWKLIY